VFRKSKARDRGASVKNKAEEDRYLGNLHLVPRSLTQTKRGASSYALQVRIGSKMKETPKKEGEKARGGEDDLF